MFSGGKGESVCWFEAYRGEKIKCRRDFLNKGPFRQQYFFLPSFTPGSCIIAQLQPLVKEQCHRRRCGGVNASHKGTSVVVSLAWESITFSLRPPPRFSLLANGFASGQKKKSSRPPASPPLLSPKKLVFSFIRTFWSVM